MSKIDILDEKIKINTVEVNKLKSQRHNTLMSYYDIKKFKINFMDSEAKTVKLSVNKHSLYGNTTTVDIDIPNAYILERLRQKFMDEKRKLNAMGVEFDYPDGKIS